MKHAFYMVALLVVITACTVEQPKSLDQQLAAVTPAERKETLLNACLSEAEWPSLKSKRSHAGSQRKHGSHNSYASEVRDMKALCKQMDLANEKKALADKCEEQVILKREKERKGGAEHAVRTQQICEQMTGLKLRSK
ncbi:MAG: hypothetical protein J0M34_05270 [Alphaproteobacteria bacterium]|nr:hypothetical protein [Alphaproteobacteria bacterium]